MKLKSNLYVFIIFINLFISCNENLNLPKPLKSIKFGVNRVEFDHQIKTIEDENLISIDNYIKVDGISTKVNFIFCECSTGSTLEGITFKSRKKLELLKILKEENKTINLKLLKIKNSDMIPLTDTLVCLFSTKLKYNKFFFNLNCVN